MPYWLYPKNSGLIMAYLGKRKNVDAVRISVTTLSSGAVENKKILLPTARGVPSVVGLMIFPPKLNCALPPPSAPAAASVRRSKLPSSGFYIVTDVKIHIINQQKTTSVGYRTESGY